jgi:CRP-like cAMP-binding protein
MNLRLRRLLAAFALGNVAEWSFVTELSIYAFRSGGTLAVGLIGIRFLVGAISSVTIAPFAAGRRGALTIITLSRLLLLGIAAALALGSVGFGFVLAAVVLDSLVAAAYRPAQSWLLPTLARSPEEMMKAAAGSSIVKTVAQAVGALSGGFAIEAVSPATAMACSASVMLLAALTSAGLDRSADPRAARRVDSIKDGLRSVPAVLRDRLLWPLVLLSGLRTLVRGLWGALAVVVALRLLGFGSSGVGILQAASGAGAMLAAPITASQIGRPGLRVPCALAFISAGALMSLVGTAPPVVAAVCLIGGWGLAMAVADATSYSILHRVLQSDALTRTIGVMESLKLGCEGLGALLAPALVAVFGLRAALVIGGLPLPLFAIASLARVSQADAIGAGRSRVVGFLHAVPLFHSSDMATIEDIAAHVKRLAVDAGTAIITQGDVGDRFYVIDQGEAEVLIDGYEIGRLGAGRAFGELALLRNRTRTATVRAVTAMDLYALDRDDFMMAITGIHAGSGSSLVPEVPTSRADPAEYSLVELMAGITALSGLNEEALFALAAQSPSRQFSAGDVVIAEGDESDALYVVMSGHAETTVAGTSVGELHPGDSFGEIGVLHNVARTATVTALDKLRVVAVPADAIHRSRAKVNEL